MNDWMDEIDGNKKLTDITMPGSHDAGVFTTDVHKKFGLKSKFAVCQHDDFNAQCTAGSRFFDCRVFVKRDGNVNEMRFGHFAGTVKVFGVPVLGEKVGRNNMEGRGGAYGGTFRDGLVQACTFVSNNPSECVILRLSHTGCPHMVVDAVKDWSGKGLNPGTDTIDVVRDHLFCGTYNIACLPLTTLRSKVVLIFDEKESWHLNSNNGLHPFNRLKDADTVKGGGIYCCGTYAASQDGRRARASRRGHEKPSGP